MLEKASRAIDPLSLYNEEKNVIDEPPKTDPELMTQLKKISAYLQESPAFKDESDHSEIIIDVRTIYLRKSFELLAREKVVLDRIKKKVGFLSLFVFGGRCNGELKTGNKTFHSKSGTPTFMRKAATHSCFTHLPCWRCSMFAPLQFFFFSPQIFFDSPCSFFSSRRRKSLSRLW